MRNSTAAVVLSALMLSGGAHAQGMMTTDGTVQTIAQGVKDSPDHTQLAAAIEAAGLAETLGGAGPYTLLAPTDEVFAALPAGLVDEMLRPENKEALTEVLLCHVIDGQVVTGDLAAMAAAGTAGPEGVEIETLGGCVLTARMTAEGGVTVTDENGTAATVTVADVLRPNGVIHVVDASFGPAGM